MIDVCLLLEGTYPYVAGGVSTWVHQLISSMKDLRFGIIYIAPSPDPTRTVKYDVPNHVLYLKEIYLHDYDLEKIRKRNPKPADYKVAQDFYEGMLRDDYSLFHDFIKLFRGNNHCIDSQVMLSSMEIWKTLEHFYQKIQTNVSFLDFFWTWRGTHLPIMQILQTEVPQAKIYHSVSTGYAGMLGAIIKRLNMGKFFLTEHGIYTHERVLEISQANWIYEREKKNFRAERDLSFFKQWWISMFRAMSHLSYIYADQIFTLFEGNKIREVLEGADEEKISIIPNGINLKGFGSVEKVKKDSPQIGLIGRVVNIKDVKTFILAAKNVLKHMPDAEFYIIGPTEEEEDYYDECLFLVESLQIQDNIKFTGRQNVKEYYSFLDVVVLTSLSEAQPYVILEANICGIPIVATDVGACREMVDGRTQLDQSIGSSGLITQVSNAEQTAEAIMKLINDKEMYEKFSEAGKKRVTMYYDQDDLLSRYLNVYEQNL
jgi:polysaccharide biosynthesis protein PelF